MAVGAVLGVVLALIPGATGAQIYQCVSSCGDIYKNPPCDFFNTPVSPSLSFSFAASFSLLLSDALFSSFSQLSSCSHPSIASS